MHFKGLKPFGLGFIWFKRCGCFQSSVVVEKKVEWLLNGMAVRFTPLLQPHSVLVCHTKETGRLLWSKQHNSPSNLDVTLGWTLLLKLFFLLWNATSSLPQCVLPTFPFWRSQNSSKKQGLLLCFLCLSHFPNDFRTFHLMSLREITSSNKYFQSSDLCSVVKDSFCHQSILKWKTA